MNIGEVIKGRRKQRKMTQTELAENKKILVVDDSDFMRMIIMQRKQCENSTAAWGGCLCCKALSGGMPRKQNRVRKNACPFIHYSYPIQNSRTLVTQNTRTLFLPR